MSLVPAGALVTEAAAAGRAVAAFNIITLEHAEAVIEGAERAGLPVILQLSENAVKFRSGRLLPIARAASASAEAAGVPVGLHLDHVKSSELLRQAVDAGFGSVMYDAAQLPYAENLEATRSAAEWAHANGLWIEAELGEVGGKDGAAPPDPHAPGARTDPDEARRFVADSGVDALAVAIGSSHAMTSRTASLDHGLLGRLAKAVEVPLVLHGSSGLPDAELAAAVAGGIRKVNIGTALNVAMTEAIRTHLTPADPRPYLTAARTAMAATAAAMIAALT
ncbi:MULTISPECIES: class II fructose-bisphosphate aldolase [unclassified Streptomyces]|uniref:class II fructose-bisphosphate aldolase n=1 Tax=unclassified Streptomyces TaxID=2593676 RepID=UPI002E34576C|nr:MULTISPECIES: class II fructose-bisphosphate aldolase [unclassified Streptomyces]WUC67683.1 class II fructose-bisphosphate aldolase [Streptomyces sp. NBC_00539]